MSYSIPPTSTDVENALTAAGETVGSVNVAGILAAVIEEWSRKTGWVPFQVTGDADTRYYEVGNGGMVQLPGYASITSVKTGVTYNGTTGDPEGGTLAIKNIGYRPIYWRQGDTSTPITWLEFLSYGGCLHRPVAVTGQVGYSTEIPDDVWQAWVDGAAARAYSSTSRSQTEGISKLTIGGRTIEFNGGEPTGWNDSYMSSINRYRRGGVS